MADKHSLLFGIEAYEDAAIEPLRYAEDDAAGLARTLNHPGGFPTAHQMLLLGNEATKHAISSVIRQSCKGLGEDDTLLVFFSGHGFVDDEGTHYLAAYDTELDDHAETSIPLQWLLDQISRSAGKQSLLFLDAAAAINDAALSEFCEQSEKYRVYTSCSAGQQSISSPSLKHGIWAHHLIEAFRAQEDALAPSGFLTAQSLDRFLQVEVPKTLKRTHTGNIPKQNPMSWGSGGEDLVVADFSEVMDERHQGLRDTMGRLKRSSFFHHRSGKVAKLPGFDKQRGHKVPKDDSPYNRSFVQNIGAEMVATEIAGYHQRIKEHFSYKRKDIRKSDDEIWTPDFRFIGTIELNTKNPAEFILSIQVTDLDDPSLLEGEAFKAVFNHQFDRIVFESSGSIPVLKIIDAVEEAEDDQVEMEYEEEVPRCSLTIADYAPQILFTEDQIEIVFPKLASIPEMVESSQRLSEALSTAKIHGLLASE